MLNSVKKNKGVIKNPVKIQQINAWKKSDLSNISSSIHSKVRASFDTTTEFLDNCINFYKEDIEFMLNSGIDIDCSDKDNLTALHQACINGKLELVIYLLSKKADINAVDKEGWTPLHISASMGSLELAKCLIDRGARLDMANYDGDLPISLVDENEFPDLKVFFQKEMDKRKIDETFYRNLEKNVMLEDVLEWKSVGIYSPPIDAVNNSTPLHVAASKNYLDILGELIPLLDKRQLNAQDSDGWTALHAAAHWGNLEACALLLKAGANMDIVTNTNETVLDTIDPELKEKLEQEINRFKVENKKTLDILDQVSIRNETATKRRTSIARQSVEWKKSTQSKDPLLERQIYSNAANNSVVSPLKSLHDDSTVQSVLPRSNNTHPGIQECTRISEDNENILDVTLPRLEEIDEPKTCTTISVTSPGASDYDSETSNFSATLAPMTVVSNHKLDNESLYNVTPRLTDGDNNSMKNIANEFNIHNNSDINTTAVCDISENSSCSDESESFNKRTEVRMRPKSDRESIAEHRSTVPKRLSILMAPAKCDESEADRRDKARRVRSFRRSTQAINLQSIATIARRQKQLENGDITDDLIEETAADVADGTICDNPTTTCVVDAALSNIERQSSTLPAQNDSTDNIRASEPVSTTVTPTNTFDVTRYTRDRNSEKIKSQEFRVTSTNRAIVKEDSSATKECDSGSFIARPVPGISRIRTNDTPTPCNTATSILPKTKSQHSNQYVVSKSSVTTNTTEDFKQDDIRQLKSIADCLSNDQIIKQELQNEISKLKQEIQELKNNKDSVDSGLNNLRTKQTDNVTNIETELAKTQEDNRRLRIQNESLLRVISKIQQELESLHKAPFPN